jgi:hypothetical protein
MHDVVNESSVYKKRVRFGGYSPTGVRIAITPNTLRYRIYDITNNRVVRDWTTLTPGTYVDIQVSASENDIYDDHTPSHAFYSEERVLAVQANFDTDIQFAAECRYLIRNLRGFES